LSEGQRDKQGQRVFRVLTSNLNTSPSGSSKPRACSARFKPAPWPTAARACSQLLSASCRASPTIQPTVASLSPVLLVGDALSNQAGKLLADRLLDSPRYSRCVEARGKFRCRPRVAFCCGFSGFQALCSHFYRTQARNPALDARFLAFRLCAFYSIPAHPECVFFTAASHRAL